MTKEAISGIKLFCKLPSVVINWCVYKGILYAKCEDDKTYVISQDGSYEELRLELTSETKHNINDFFVEMGDSNA